MIVDIHKFLLSLGLTKKETELFIASLKYGPQTASTMSKKTGTARSTINFLFEELIKKGLASKESRENTTYFNVIQPESLEYIMLEKEAQAKKQIKELKELIPLLNSLKNKLSPIPKVRYFEGIEGLKKLVDDTCEKDEEVLFISGHNDMHPSIREYIEQIYIPISKKHTNKNKMIINDGKLAREYLKKAEGIYNDVILIDSKKNPFTLTTAIHNNKVLFASYDPKDLTGVIIENQLIADQMKELFKIAAGYFKK